MAVVLVVADDLTGANATGARYAARGLRTATVHDIDRLAAFRASFEVVVVSTDSRHLAPEEAAERVRRTIEGAGPVDLVVKRIDTTLRGNLGAEVDAALTSAAANTARPVRALCVPAFPASGRTTVGGLQLVDGQALTDTDAAADPLSPVASARVTEVLGRQSRRRAVEVPLDVVSSGGPELVAALAQDADVLVCDALEDAHIRTIAAAAAEVEAVTWLSVDPGPFGAALADALGLSTPADGGLTALAVAGSVTEVTQRQLAAVERQLGATFVDADASDLDPAALARAVSEAAAATGEGIVGVRTAASPSDVVALDAAAAQRIPVALGELTRTVLDRGATGGMYLTGGDVVAGVVDAVGADGLEVDEEVLPLAVAGWLVGGPHDGLPVVTKGGLIGDETAAIMCLEHLRSRMRARRRTVYARPPA